MVVDTRDDDVGGGMIRGAMHVADGMFADLLPSLLGRICAMAIASTVHVVFHCMESARRGPRCALRLAVYLAAVRGEPLEGLPGGTQILPDHWINGGGGGGGSSIEIRVLRGGADLWIRRFFEDPSMVQNFDDNYWGFGPLSCDDYEGTTATTGDDAREGKQLHVLYERPRDQPATPWSGAGAAVTATIADQQAAEEGNMREDDGGGGVEGGELTRTRVSKASRPPPRSLSSFAPKEGRMHGSHVLGSSCGGGSRTSVLWEL